VAAAAIGTDIYVFGGTRLDMSSTFDADSTQTIWKYSTTANSWTTVAASMPQPIQWAKALAANGKIYVIGGGHFRVDLFANTQTTLANYATVYEFTPPATLTAKAPLPVATKMLVGDAIGGK